MLAEQNRQRAERGDEPGGEAGQKPDEDKAHLSSGSEVATCRFQMRLAWRYRSVGAFIAHRAPNLSE
jgi:hypothetical protein